MVAVRRPLLFSVIGAYRRPLFWRPPEKKWPTSSISKRGGRAGGPAIMSRYRRPLFWKSGRRRTPMGKASPRRSLFSQKLEKVTDVPDTWSQIISCRGTVGHFSRRPGGPGAGRGPGAPPQKSGRRRAPIGAGRRPLFLIRIKSGRRQDAIMTSATSGFRHTEKS